MATMSTKLQTCPVHFLRPTKVLLVSRYKRNPTEDFHFPAYDSLPLNN